MKDLSIYVHIPFCVRKCLYCDFLSFPVGGELSYVNPNVSDEKHSFAHSNVVKEVESYVNRLLQEIEAAAPAYGDFRVITIFIGGGTPTLLPKGQIAALLAKIRACYRVEPEAEITIEMNPGTASRDKMQEYITAGINRLSIGLQSTDDEELARIGRIHGYAAFLETYRLAREAGFANINIDLMSALPGQDMESWKKTLQRVKELSPEHISAYSLMLEEGTPLYERRENYRFPSEEEDRKMYVFTGNYLKECGYHRYEISNYAKEGYECRHNKVYWQRGNYVGFGLGASSMVDNVRWHNPDEFARYDAYAQARCDASNNSSALFTLFSAYIEPQKLSVSEQMEEFMFLGLRLTGGVNINDFQANFGRSIEEVYGSVLTKFYGQHLLEKEGDYIRLTEKGIDVSNYVMAEFLF